MIDDQPTKINSDAAGKTRDTHHRSSATPVNGHTINIQIAPFSYYRGVWTPFAIATLPDQRQVVYTLKAYGGETSTRPEDVGLASEAFVTLQAEALSVKDTRALIRRVIDERWT